MTTKGPGYGHNRKRARNAELYALFEAGTSGVELARRYGITRARVYQIVAAEARRAAGAGK